MNKNTKKIVKGAAIGAAALVALYKFFPEQATNALRKIPIGKDGNGMTGGGEMA
jgi:hypothetical protein